MISDPAEHEAATKLRNKCSGLVRSVCSLSTFGLLCRQDNQWKLEDAMAEARALAAEVNRRSRYSKVSINVIVGRVADTDVEATRAIRQEVSDLIAEMQEGIATLNVDKVRDAADKARSVGKMLSPEAQKSVQSAIAAARDIAKKIVKAGETAAATIDAETLAKLVRARTEFLDLPNADDVAVEPIAVDGGSRGVDLDAGDRDPADGVSVDQMAWPGEATPAAEPADGVPAEPPPARRAFDWEG